MPLTLHYHPLSSYCWKLLIALAENGAPFEAKMINLSAPAERTAFAALWPTGKIPLLVDGDRVVPESSIQIEYLDHHHPGSGRLIPADFEGQLQTRLWDRIFDLHVMDPMQRHIAQLLRPEAQRDSIAMAATVEGLGQAYALIDDRMGEHPWAAGHAFTLADCAAAPALFYAATVRAFSPSQTRLCAYFERLMARPSVEQVLQQAQPWFKFYPLRAALPPRFLTDRPTPQS